MKDTQNIQDFDNPVGEWATARVWNIHASGEDIQRIHDMLMKNVHEAIKHVYSRGLYKITILPMPKNEIALNGYDGEGIKMIVEALA